MINIMREGMAQPYSVKGSTTLLDVIVKGIFTIIQ